MYTTPLCFHVLMLAATLASASSQAQPARASTQHDGQWAVALVCDDINDKSGGAKGYRFDFPVQITNGQISGQHGTPGQPASVSFSGVVNEGGALDIQANGMTGDPNYAVDKPTKGTRYRYTMQGTLGESSGQAKRRELRPCTASFTKR
jgi:hypothetical protein